MKIDNRDQFSAEQLEREISRLQLWLQVIKREEIKEHKRQSMVHLGHCFKTSQGQYVIVANVPQESETKQAWITIPTSSRGFG